MTSEPAEAEPSDPYLTRMRAARKSPAVLKLRLAALRSEAPTVIILAFEGDDDKIVYSQWLRRVRPGLTYEPFPCSGKKGVLQLREVVARDVSGIGRGIYYFVDRDFDDLRGQLPDERTFMTDKYSVENYLVSEETLRELLKNEFHCHGRPDVRGSIGAKFDGDYKAFLIATTELNWRIFVTRRSWIKLHKPLPTRIGMIASVNIGYVTASAGSPEDLVVWAGALEDDESLMLRTEFDHLDPRDRYRGKFALLFFQSWLERLSEEYSDPHVGLFQDIDRSSKVRRNELCLGGFASKSPLPDGLSAFADAIA